MQIQNIILKKGWNLVGFCIGNFNIEDLLKDSRIIEIKSTNKSYNSNVKKIFNTLDKININSGYFIKSSENFTLTIKGELLDYSKLSKKD